MNRSFRSIWNASLGAWVAVSEMSRAGRGGRAVASSLVVAFALVSPAGAATLYWDINGNTAGLGGAGSWTSPNFWNTSATGTGGTLSTWNNATLDQAIFGGTAGAVTIVGTVDANGITFNTTGYSLTGGTLNLGGATPTVTTGAGLSATIGSIVSGTAGLTKAGAGTLTLSGVNTFSGGINVTGGILSVNGNASLGAASNGIVMANGTQLTASTGTNLAASRVVTLTSGTVTLSGSRVGSARFTGAGGISGLGGFTLSNNANDYTGQTVFSGAGATYSFTSIADLGVASALGAPVTVANGTVLSNATSGGMILAYTGTGGSSNRNFSLSNSGGTVTLRNSGSGTLTLTGGIVLGGTGGFTNITFNAATGDLALQGVISETIARNVSFSGPAGRTITLTGANTYSGGTIITGGVKVLVPVLANQGVASSLGALSGGFNINNSIAINTGGTLSYTGGATSTNRGFIFTNGNGTVSNDGSGALALSGNFTLSAANSNATLAGTYSATPNTISGVVSGAGGLTVNTAGAWALSGTNTYTGATIVNAGTLRAGAAAGGQAFGVNSAVTLADAAGATLDLNGFNQAIGSLSGGGTTGGNVTLGASTLTTGGNNTSTTYAGAISGTGGLSKAGTGTQVLTGNNLYSGATNISAGTLQVGDGGTSGTLGTGVIVNNASLIFNRSDALGVGGVITGAGAIRQVGSGLTTLTANSGAFAGTTSIEAGALAVNGRLCGTMNVQSGGKLQGTGTVCDTNNFTGGTVAPGNSIGTLTVAGNYTGSGGLLDMEAVLSGTGSPADRLLITGNATGTTTVKVTNVGGTGASTGVGNTDGISIIQVGGASTASTFQLQGGYAAAGPYQYHLNFFAPGASAAGQADPLLGTLVFGDYRLQSAMDASGAPIPVPQVGGYQAMPSGALRYGSSLLNGLHARMGEIRRLQSTPGAMEEGLPQKEFFLREQTSRTDFSGDRGPSYDQDVDFVQVGGNLVKWDIGETGSTLRMGGALSFGTSKLSVKGSSAKVDLKGSTLALMSTYQGAGGKYIDVLAQGTRYRANVRTSERGTVGDPKGWGVGLSVEGGYPFEVGERLTLEPQAQLAYQRVRFDRFTDVDNITVDLENGNSLRGRVGVRLQSIYEARGQQWSPYAEVNLLHEFLKGATVQASGVGFGSDSGGTGLQFGAGLNARLARNATLFLKLGYEKGIGKGTANTWSGTLGVRMSF